MAGLTQVTFGGSGGIMTTAGLELPYYVVPWLLKTRGESSRRGK